MQTPDIPRDTAQEVLVPVEPLRDLVRQVLVKQRMFAAEAQIAADRLVEADLRGIHSHGTRALPRYLQAMEMGDIDPRAESVTVCETPAMAVIDAGKGMGHVAATRGMQAAIRKAALLRFRPIMMTTAAALLGGVPLMIGAGTGAEIRQPLGYSMVGGLLVSQALTLYTTPVIYIYLDRLSTYLASLTSGREVPEKAQPTAAAAE